MLRRRRSVLLSCALLVVAAAMVEEQRVEEYMRRGLRWPPLQWTPDTPGWRSLWQRREVQIRAIQDVQQRWDGWNGLVQSASLTPNFTRNGFEIVQAPVAIHEKLAASLHAGLQTDLPKEQGWSDSLCSLQSACVHPRFVEQQGLNDWVLAELQPLLEAWSATRLQPVIAYGLRVYGNGSTLRMHLDKACCSR